MNEFNSKRLRTEDNENIYLDVRPFGDNEGDAIDSYLREALESLRIGVGTFGPKRIVLICEPASFIPSSANTWLQQLQEMGVSVEIDPQHRETTE